MCTLWWTSSRPSNFPAPGNCSFSTSMDSTILSHYMWSIHHLIFVFLGLTSHGMISRFIHIAAHDGIFFFLWMNNTQLSVCVILPILKNVHLCIRKSSYGEGDLPQPGSLPACPWRLGLSQAKARSKVFHQVSHVGGRVPSTWLIFHLFLQACIRQLYWKWISWDLNQSPRGMLMSQVGCSLSFFAAMTAPWWHFPYSPAVVCSVLAIWRVLQYCEAAYTCLK